MFQQLYENVVRFASEGALAGELKLARDEYQKRTGEMFESDANFERRIASFLEWYTLDRPLSFRPGLVTPTHYFLETHGASLSAADAARLKGLTETTLSVFEFRGAKNEHFSVLDLLSKTRHKVFERRKAAGLEAGDLMEARLVPYDDKILFADAFAVHPREARKTILKAAKIFRKSGGDRLDMVHRIAFFSHRCERYRHVDPKQIFAEFLTSMPA
ncbi:MAG: hypothetical protein HYZ27_08305 [Deltaproteobacteria bacterium]|nr:hypothetical protein [Deltaproteobacteria bacterium]